MKFERGKSVKGALGLGIPLKRVVRVLQWRKQDGDVGFFILDADKAQRALKEVSEGKGSLADYLIDLFGERTPGQKYHETLLSDLRGYRLEYNGKIYSIPEK